MDNKIIVGLDIGSTKVCVIAGRRNEYGKTEILGEGRAALNEGVVRTGIITKIDSTAEAIQAAVGQLQASVDGHIHIGEVNVNIDSVHIRGNAHRIGLTRRNTQDEIGVADVAQLNEDMQRVNPPLGSQNIHVLPQKYRVDGESGVADPVGMIGVRLEADFYVISLQANVIQNLELCMRRVGLDVNRMLFSPLASGLAVLSEDEKEQGVALVDIGGGTTNIAIYYEGIVRHVAVLPFGGDSITRDIAHGCGVTRQQAEAMKTRHGVATPETTQHKDRIVVPGLRDRLPTLVSMKNVAYIIEARLSEIVEMVYLEIEKSGYKSRIRNVGIVLTGGTARLKNTAKLFTDLTDMHTRIGNAGEHLGMSRSGHLREPQYATAVGLVLAGFQALDARENRYQQHKPATQARPEPAKTNGGLFGKLKTWLSEDLEDKTDY